MKEKIYWRAASLLPLLLPLVTLISAWLRGSIVASPAPSASVVQVFLLGSLFIGGVIYVLFLVFMQRLIWSKPVRYDRKVSLISPPIYLVIFILGFQLYWIITSSGNWMDNPRLLGTYALLVLMIGYIYVGIAWGIRGILQRLGLFRE